MQVKLYPFQTKALGNLRTQVAAAFDEYARTSMPQVVSYTAPTGAGKTIVMTALMESVFTGDDMYMEHPEAIFVWLSDSPELNMQSKLKVNDKADRILYSQTVVVEEASFNQETLDDGKVYFLNTQKLGRNSRLVKHSDGRQFTIWETMANTVREKGDRLCFIIDEAHRGMQGKNAAEATTIMQKFLKGSKADELPVMPVVIGMSATPERFNRLVASIGATTIRNVVTTADEVRASGLLKDRIVITYPDAVNNDMAVLQSATDDWKDKRQHWDQYCREQHYAYINPIFVVQVENGTGGNVSDTDLGECLRKIAERTGEVYTCGEVVHTFGQTEKTLMVNGMEIMYIEPSSIADDRRVKIVFFKENLSTGWDCPRAETMMSFRHAKDATYIAQLLGRMVRTPMQMRVQVDDTLNDVHLFLPYFDAETVKCVIDELQSSEGGNISTDIVGESIGSKKIVTMSVEPVVRMANETYTRTEHGYPPSVATQPQTAQNTATSLPPNTALPNDNTSMGKPTTDTVETSVAAEPKLDRKAIEQAINDMALLTYKVRNIRTKNYLTSLLELSGLLSTSGTAPDIDENVRNEIVDRIEEYIDSLKKKGVYEELADKVKLFKLTSLTFDVYGKNVSNSAGNSIYTSTDADIDRQLRHAEAILSSEGLANQYGRRHYNAANPNAYKIDLILYTADTANIEALQDYAKDKFHSLIDTYRRDAIKLKPRDKKEYDSIVADGDEVSKHNLCLPDTICSLRDYEGKVYTDHLYVEENGEARIKLNSWEEGVIAEEEAKPSFVCWLRNTPRASWALTIPYTINNVTKPTYPDFLVVHKAGNGYVVDIIEPHDPTRTDNLPKAKGFADYAKENPGIGSIQLVRVKKTIAGEKFLRLDLSKMSVREKVRKAMTNEELNHIFDTEA